MSANIVREKNKMTEKVRKWVLFLAMYAMEACGWIVKDVMEPDEDLLTATIVMEQEPAMSAVVLDILMLLQVAELMKEM